MGLYIDMKMPEDSDMIVIYSDGTARKYLSHTKVIIDEAKAISITTTNMRSVVMCKDCAYLMHDKYGSWCFNNYEENLKDNDFCSHGKKKEN